VTFIVDLPDGVGLDREQIAETIRCWAKCLRDRADELLGPATPRESGAQAEA
jgi:hypothetical protein